MVARWSRGALHGVVRERCSSNHIVLKDWLPTAKPVSQESEVCPEEEATILATHWSVGLLFFFFGVYSHPLVSDLPAAVQS